MFLEQIQLRVDEGKEDLVGRIIRKLSVVKDARTSGPGEVLVEIHPTAPDNGLLARSIIKTISHVRYCVN